jgi:uncharacterized RDD family membrane protein YckC
MEYEHAGIFQIDHRYQIASPSRQMHNPDRMGYLERSSQMDTAMARPQNQPSFLQATGKSFGIRAGAYLIDTIIIFVINISTSAVSGLIFGIIYALVKGQAPALSEQSDQWLNYFIGFIFMTIYFTLFEWLYGATPGKLVRGMRVIKEDGSACGLGPAFIRALLRPIDGLIFGLVAYLNMIAPLYQRVGDKAAKTIVVGSKDAVIQQPRPWWGFFAALVSYLAIDAIVLFFWFIAVTR